MPSVVSLDGPLLLAGLVAMVFGRLVLRPHQYQIMCQFIGTFWAQLSLGVSWSLARLTPIFSALSQPPFKSAYGWMFVPFLVYVPISGLFLSLTWSIPSHVSGPYGDYRVFVQLINFAFMALSTRALAAALRTESAGELFWHVMTGAVLIHGLASLYQITAWIFSLPLIGISRAFDLTEEVGTPDIATFSIEDTDILRLSGLIGEPKTAAAFFGAYLVAYLLRTFASSARSSTPEKAALLLAVVCFIGSASTSGLLGAVLGLAWALVTLARSTRFALLWVSIVAIVVGSFVFLGVLPAFSADVRTISEIVSLRTVERFGDQLDPPVEASLSWFTSSASAMLLGTGLGGSTFLIAQTLGITFQYAYAANIGAVLLLAELGLIGILLLLIPLAVLTHILSVRIFEEHDDDRLRNALTLGGFGIGVMAQMLCGSGTSLGFILGTGAIWAAAELGTTGRARKQ
jgi:hypothetical protein